MDSYSCDTRGSKHVLSPTENDLTDTLINTGILPQFTTSRSKNDTRHKTFHQITINNPTTLQLSRTNATIDPTQTESLKIRLSLCTLKKLTGSSMCGGGQAKEEEEEENPRPGATVRSEPRFGCVSDRTTGWAKSPIMPCRRRDPGRALSCFRQGKTSANVRSLNWWCDVYG
jgi:hypothetical protein